MKLYSIAYTDYMLGVPLIASVGYTMFRTVAEAQAEVRADAKRATERAANEGLHDPKFEITFHDGPHPHWEEDDDDMGMEKMPGWFEITGLQEPHDNERSEILTGLILVHELPEIVTGRILVQELPDA